MRKIARRHRRTVVLAIVLLLFAWIVWAFFFRVTEHVTTVTIGRSDIESSVTALGTVQPHSYVDVGSQASGEIRRIRVQPGDTVHRGDLLVEIDPSVQQSKVDVDQATLASLRAQLAGAQAQQVLAQQQYDRQKRMAADGSTRDEDVQTAYAALVEARTTLDNLRAQIAGAHSNLSGDEAQLGYTRIYAPMSGSVVTLDAREGQTLNATYQTPNILRIADLSTMTVWTQVSEADILSVKPGMPVYFTTLGSADRRWTAVVRQILPAPPNPATSPDSSGQQAATPASAQTTGKVVLYTVLFDVANPDRELMPQMSAQVFFVAARTHGVIAAPLAAMTPVEGKPGQYTARVLEDDRIVARDVRIGVHDRLSGEVLSGLAPGDRLVTGVTRTHAADGRFTW
ncbi:efflux RND transporter periplasmic adaptor subunit [Paraburkholderia caballeronis]|uniref:efflux RND transporter periplasmic adaptor subunit n=1 Tax=Paraburkholderia caballeronis TaxID=416943 RepID=UPI0010664BDA|nr:efflux RND transporter periplasmic adaptor subunit [Paraburkholderia caballeronis]TDV04354.1 macrolide-specific efflux system membrane fusion protein [Paraburkholderia caballeronis]TDV17712.1 macrolide-specific efflux system membrane fusion protein [Paraburkholderia caballeronis]TDV18742.1 macrolide-specific efflux system membrane fusion protein [Paraburkholderia caballeronis]TDV35521.1 macrolide-specific efflux system membrane fusion protein [Paraburkholderia caballeronis]